MLKKRFSLRLMEKHITISQLIKKLRLILSFENIEVVDYWDADLCAIGIKRKDRLVYISTVSYLGLPVLRYDFDLEILTGQKLHEFVIDKRGRNVSEAELINEIREFLEI